MAAPGKATASSRWGAFLSSAVTSVESRLDTMLTEGGEENRGSGAEAPKPVTGAASSSRTNANPRPSANDRLQARLAKAMSGKTGTGQGQGQGQGGASPRGSADVSRSSAETARTEKLVEDTELEGPGEATVTMPAVASSHVSAEKKEGERRSLEDGPSLERDGANGTKEVVPKIELPLADVAQLTQDVDEIKKRQEEEIMGYIEKIDTLEAKVKYLSSHAAEAAKSSASEAPTGSVERRLAEKDEKIALLMQEGQKLSITEQSLRTTLKKLRLQMSDGEKQAEELRKSHQKADAELAALRSKLDSEEDSSSIREEARKATAGMQREMDSLRTEKTAREETIRKLEQEAKMTAEKTAASHTQALNQAVAAERAKLKVLEDTVDSLRSEREATAEKARQEALEAREKLERTTERGRAAEEELKHEVASLEGKLEAMRTSAEEAFSGPGEEGQLKLVRQIETLQSQYASASDNWQGIEASLLTKVSTLEKERDEAQRRESEMRKKAREASNRCRSLDEELQDLQPQHAQLQQELDSCREQLSALQASLKSAGKELEQTKAELEKQQDQASSRQFRADSMSQQWTDEAAVAAAANTPGHKSFHRSDSRPDSPLLAVQRTFSADLISAGLPVPGRSSRRITTPGSGSIPDSPGEGLGLIRRLSSQQQLRSHPAISSFDQALEPLGMQSPPPPVPDRPPSVPETNPMSPRDMAQDMISVSTVAAGPSVQLVERMSAAIRRLEAEKMTAKEEMARVCNQRDEARTDMLSLMKEVEAGKSAGDKITKLEAELENINSRYQTTLEMLGEKSELVEELKADVQDVKAMYRELVESTIK